MFDPRTKNHCTKMFLVLFLLLLGANEAAQTVVKSNVGDMLSFLERLAVSNPLSLNHFCCCVQV